jgi:tetratricopeptide (TPR) repeat protein
MAVGGAQHLLSIFRGGFDRQAVTKVTGGTARTILALVNTSLLRTSEPGRFSLLEVVRQYAAEKRSGDHALHERHAEYYLGLLASSMGSIDGDSPKGSLLRIEHDLENVRSAWTWALEHERFDLCRDATEALGIFFHAKARTQEALRVFGATSRALEEHPNPELKAHMLFQQGSFSNDIDDLEAAEHYLLKGLELAEGLGDVVLMIKSVRTLASVCNARGSYDQALAYAREALALARSRGLTDLIVSSRDLLAMTEEFRGNFAASEVHYLFVLDHHRQRGQVRLLI